MFGAHAGFDEFIAQVDRVLHTDGKANGFAALAVFVPMGDDVANQLRPVHPLGKLALNVIAGLHLHALKVRLRRRIDAGFNEIALLDQGRDLRRLDDRFEYAAQSAPVAAARRCG